MALNQGIEVGGREAQEQRGVFIQPETAWVKGKEIIEKKQVKRSTFSVGFHPNSFVGQV